MTPSYRLLFSIDGFLRLVAGILLGRIASQMVSLVLVLLVLERYGSPALAGLATFLSLAPGLLVSPIAGTLLDRYGRRRLIVLDYLVATTALVLLAGLSLADALPVPLFLVIVAAQSLTFPLSTVGQRTLFPLVVPRPLWARANAIDSNGYAVSSVIGPAIAGAVVAAFHGEGGLIASAAAFLAAAIVTVTAPDVHVEGTDHGSILGAAWQGIVHVAGHPTLRGIATGASLASVASGILFISIPVIVLRELGGTSVLVGQLFALMGGVAFIAVLVVGRWHIEGRERTLMMRSLILGIVAAGLLIAKPELAWVVVAVVVRGLSEAFFDVPMFTLRQRTTDPAWLGRAFSVSMALNFVGYPIGTAVGGALVSISASLALSVAIGFWIAAVIAMYLFIPAD